MYPVCMQPFLCGCGATPWDLIPERTPEEHKPDDGKGVGSMINAQGQNNKLKFSYESDAAASFLVIQHDAAVTDYQLRMLENNSVKHVISPEMVRKEGLACFYYNITSRISLSFFLRRQKLSREEFLRLLLQITSSISDSSSYLLDPESFIFNIEYIYINPETFEPALVYLPMKIGQNGCGTLQSFISELLMMHIQAEGFDNGNFVQRILSVAKSEVFSLKACVELLSELVYGSEQGKKSAQHGEAGGKKAENGEPWNAESGKVERSTANNYIKVKKEEKKEEKEKKVEKNGSKNLIVVLMIVLQFAMGSIIYTSRGFLEKVGENKTVTYAAVLMIVLAVDVLIFKRLYDARLIFVKQVEPKPDTEVLGQKSRVGGNEVNMMDGMGYWSVDKRSKATYAGDTNGYTEIVCKTELLGKDVKGIPALRCTGKHGSDEDIVLDKDDFVIGRLEGHVDHIINNNAVGKLHAQLVIKKGSCFVKDLNSMNGTFINNTRIESNKEFELKDSDRLRFANCEFVLVHG